MPPPPECTRDHADTQAGFHAALWSPQQTPPGLHARPGLERRFAVYRNNVQHGLSKALAEKFPVVERLVGAEFFTAMARVFAATHPPEHPVLHEWGAAFPAFLDGFAPVAGLPYLSDVARLERARGTAYHAADAARADLTALTTALTTADPASLRLRLAPAVSAFDSRFPAVSIWAQNQPDAANRPLPPGPEFALIGRVPGFAVITAPLDAGQHASLRALLAGQTLGAAVSTSQADPAPLLALLIRHHLIAAIEGDPV